jgi:hypothetical protein
MLLAALWKPCQRGPFSLGQGTGLVEGPRCVRRGPRPRWLPSLLQGQGLLMRRSQVVRQWVWKLQRGTSSVRQRARRLRQQGTLSVRPVPVAELA